MNRKKVQDEINELLMKFVVEVKLNAVLSLTDINKYSEDVLIPLLGEVYNWRALKNLNTSDRYNFPAVDLGDDDVRVAVQVTSTVGAQKVVTTLRKFKEHDLQERFDHLVVYIITEKPKNPLASKNLNNEIDGTFTFDARRDYRDYTDLLQEINTFDLDQLVRVRDILEENFGDGKVSLAEVETRASASLRNQLVRLKNTRKYIPGIFVEVSETKDKTRYFVNPTLFFNRLLEDMDHLHLKPLNRHLAKLQLEPVRFELPEGARQLESVVDLEAKTRHISTCLEGVRQKVETYYQARYRSTPLEGVPETLVPLGNELQFPLSTSGFFLRDDLENITEKLNLLNAQVLFLVARAGQGKTNFVCDLAERVLTKNALPALFMTGQELGKIAADQSGKYILKEAFEGDHDMGFMLDRLDKLGARKNCPVTLIIDGINEHTDLAAFAQHLERFAEGVVKRPHLRLILTCREEYFEERFSNFKSASFSDRTVFLENFNRKMRPKHQQHMLESYLDFFKLNYSYMSEQVRQILQEDTLLLRMFCESYGNPDGETYTDLQQVLDVYRYEVFQLYLSTKLASISQREAHGSNVPGATLPFENALDAVVGAMVESESFANLKLADVNSEHYPALYSLLGEDIILRLDLSDDRDPFGGRIEVINFTFDEFRDFLIAKYLVGLFRSNPEAFDTKLKALVKPECPVAEGVKKYIFIASRQPAGRAIHNLIVDSDWFEQTFVEAIFSVRDDLIGEKDVNEVVRQFYRDERSAAWIITSLLVRWDLERYPNLNIHTLFDIFDEMDKFAFDAYVRPAFGRRQWMGYNNVHSWSLDGLVKEVDQAESEQVPELIFEALIYFSDLHGEQYNFPAYGALCHYVDNYPEPALNLLTRHTNAQHLGVQAQVWRLLARIKHADSLEIPYPVIEKAHERLREIDQLSKQIGGIIVQHKNYIDTLRQQLNWFLEDRTFLHPTFSLLDSKFAGLSMHDEEGQS